MIEHNKQLSNFINQANNAIENAKNSQELLDIIESARIFKGNFKYNHKDILIYMAIAFSSLLIASYFFITFNHGFWLTVLVLSILAIIIITKKFFNRGKSIDGLADAIFWKDLYFDNHLQNSNDEHYAIESLKKRFNDFHRGNYSQNINTLLKSHYSSNGQAFDYYYFNFHYVDERIVEKTDSDGKHVEEKVYDHYDRYGFIVPSNVVKNVRILQSSKLIGHNKGDYEPASINFRKTFSVKTTEVFEASKLLTPSIVELFESLPKDFKNIVMEFNEDEFLFSFTDKNTISAQRKYDFKDIDLFLAEISEIQKLPKLLKFHTISEQFIRSTQNSFD